MSILTYGSIVVEARFFGSKWYKVSENYMSYFIQNMEFLL